MKYNTLKQQAPSAESIKSAKASYTKPALQNLGSVAELTKGGSGSGSDTQKANNANPSHPVH